MIGGKWILITSVCIYSIYGEFASAADSGFYFSAALGRTREMPMSAGTNILVGSPPAVIVHVDPNHTDAESRTVAWSLGTGYRFNPHFAAELGYMDFGTIRITESYDIVTNPVPFPFPSNFVNVYSSNITGPALSLLVSAPIDKHFGVFLRTGMLFADRTLKAAGPGGVNETFGRKLWLGGIGINWFYTNHWTIQAEYQRTGKLQQSLFGGATKLEQLSLSVQFRR